MRKLSINHTKIIPTWAGIEMRLTIFDVSHETHNNLVMFFCSRKMSCNGGYSFDKNEVRRTSQPGDTVVHTNGGVMFVPSPTLNQKISDKIGEITFLLHHNDGEHENPIHNCYTQLQKVLTNLHALGLCNKDFINQTKAKFQTEFNLQLEPDHNNTSQSSSDSNCEEANNAINSVNNILGTKFTKEFGARWKEVFGENGEVQLQLDGKLKKEYVAWYLSKFKKANFEDYEFRPLDGHEGYVQLYINKLPSLETSDVLESDLCQAMQNFNMS